MTVQQVEDPDTVEAVATKAEDFSLVNVLVDRELLAVRVPPLDDVDDAVNAALMRRPPPAGGAVRVHIYAYQ